MGTFQIRSVLILKNCFEFLQKCLLLEKKLTTFLKIGRWLSFPNHIVHFARRPSRFWPYTTYQKKDRKVVVISKSYCPFCKKAKQVLAIYNIPKECIEIREIENDPNCEEIQRYMMELTGGRSVPRVFIGGKCIGGGDET